MSIIYNGVDIEKFSKNDNNLKHNDFVLYVGRIEPIKNINIIIKIYSQLSWLIISAMDPSQICLLRFSIKKKRIFMNTNAIPKHSF